MGTIYRRGNTWWLECRDGGVRRREPLRNPDGTPCRTREEAEKERRRLRAPAISKDALIRAQAAAAEARRIADRLAGEERAQAPGLPQAWAEYVRHPRRNKCGDGTLYVYHGQWERMRAWLASQKPPVTRLDGITPEVAEAYTADLLSSGITASTCNRHVTFLRSFFRLLVPGADPFAGVPLQRFHPRSRRALTRAELVSLLDHANGETRTLLLLGAATGLRLGDCCTLQWSEVDVEAGCVRRGTRKTHAEVGVPLQVLSLMGTPREGPVFPQMCADYQAGRAGRSRVCSRLMSVFRAAGIAVHEEGPHPGRARAAVTTGFHALRHTWVSAMSEGGAPPALIQQAVGHASPAMTEYYTHVTVTGLRSVAEAVGRALMPANSERDALEREVIDLARRADIAALRRAREILSEQPSEEPQDEHPDRQ